MRLTSPNKNNKELTAETTREAAISCLKKHLELDIQGSKVSTEMALEILVHAASLGQSIEASCAELDVADSNTIRDYLNGAFTASTLSSLEKQVNSALLSDLPNKVYLKAQDLAIDLHEQCFYGKDEQLLASVNHGIKDPRVKRWQQ